VAARDFRVYLGICFPPYGFGWFKQLVLPYCSFRCRIGRRFLKKNIKKKLQSQTPTDENKLHAKQPLPTDQISQTFSEHADAPDVSVLQYSGHITAEQWKKGQEGR
jgi:hypothetical protein